LAILASLAFMLSFPSKSVKDYGLALPCGVS
jgi:hypothetical protein